MSERITAPIVHWNVEKAYGFIQADRQRVFLHIRDFTTRPQRSIQEGDLVQFSMGKDSQGRPCAIRAMHILSPDTFSRPALPTHSRRPSRDHRLKPETLVILLLLLALPILALLKLALPLLTMCIAIVAISAITYLVYALDKMRAQAEDWRIPESTLHALALIGGWPGAFLAQQFLRHKCAKMRFQIPFWLTVAAYQYLALDYLIAWRMSHAIRAAILDGWTRIVS